MNRQVRITGDGSHTLYVAGLDETYHSTFGAVQESEHVFIRQGLDTLQKQSIRILEIGFGTGLNALLTLQYAVLREMAVRYHTVEKYPLTEDEYLALNYDEFLPGQFSGFLRTIHEADWDKETEIAPGFRVRKEKADFREMRLHGTYDLVYYDAFDPAKQPHLWTAEIFQPIADHMPRGGILVSYTSKGSVRRELTASGFRVLKVPGPPGKREMLRAVRH